MSLATLGRRTILRGMGGITLALPTLESMLNRNGTAHADGSALGKRYVVCFGGYSLGTNYDKRPEMFTPKREGFEYDITLGIEPFGGFPNPRTTEPVSKEISIVSGLLIPWGGGDKESDPGKIPRGGKPPNHHSYQTRPLLTGQRSTGNEATGYLPAGSPSSDQVVADADVNRGKTKFPSLTFAVQAMDYYYGSTVNGMSARPDATGWMTPQDRPSLAWKSLFEGFEPSPADGAAAAKQFALLKKQKKSVLDAVLVPGRVSKLLGRVSAADRLALEQHFQHIRNLEGQLDKVTKLSASCARPSGPPQDPPLGPVFKEDVSTPASEYSNEDERARLFVDFTHMALACDLTRAVSIMFTGAQSDLNMYQLIGPQYLRGPVNLHGLSHGFNNGQGDQAELARGIAWHMKHFASLVAKLRDTPEGAGSVLDNSALVFVNEGGHGRMPESPENPDKGAHSTEGMVAVIAGRAGGLNPGQHIRAPEAHPAQILISAMNAVGVPSDKLGEVSGTIPRLFG